MPCSDNACKMFMLQSFVTVPLLISRLCCEINRGEVWFACVCAHRHTDVNVGGCTLSVCTFLLVWVFAFVFVARCQRRLADIVHFYTLGRGRWGFGTGRSVGSVDVRSETVVGNLLDRSKQDAGSVRIPHPLCENCSVLLMFSH